MPCPFCSPDKRLEILEVMKKQFGEEEVKVMVWMDARWQGQKKEGMYNTQRKLRPELMTINVLLKTFQQLLAVCTTHCQEIRWIRLLIDLYFVQLKPNTLLVFTDFVAVMVLRAFQTKIVSVDGHAVNDNVVCVSNRHVSTVEDTKKVKGKSVFVRDDLEIFDVDGYHYFEETYSKS